MTAAVYGHVDVVRILAAAGADLDAKTASGLMPPAGTNAAGPDAVESLLGEMHREEILELEGATALIEATQRDYVDVAKALLQEGADPNIRTRRGKTAMDVAKQKGNVEMIRALQRALQAE